MIVRIITHKNYLDTHAQYKIPVLVDDKTIDDPTAEDLVTAAQWKKMYGGDVVLPYAPALNEGQELSDLPKGNWSFKEMDDKAGEKACAKTQQYMQKMIDKAEAAESNIVKR